jgi:hypothetical protein
LKTSASAINSDPEGYLRKEHWGGRPNIDTEKKELRVILGNSETETAQAILTRAFFNSSRFAMCCA